MRFTTASQLVHEMVEACDEKRLLRLQDQFAGVNLLIVDELGYVSLTQTGSELLSDVFSWRCKNRAIIVTSNLSFQNWISVIASERLTGALLDRITHHRPPQPPHPASPRKSTSAKRPPKSKWTLAKRPLPDRSA